MRPLPPSLIPSSLIPSFPLSPFFPSPKINPPISRSLRWIIKSALLCKRTYVGKIHFRRLFVPLYRVPRVLAPSLFPSLSFSLSVSLSPPPRTSTLHHIPRCKAIPSTGIAGQLSFPRQNKQPWRPS